MHQQRFTASSETSPWCVLWAIMALCSLAAARTHSNILQNKHKFPLFQSTALGNSTYAVDAPGSVRLCMRLYSNCLSSLLAILTESQCVYIVFKGVKSRTVLRNRKLSTGF